MISATVKPTVVILCMVCTIWILTDGHADKNYINNNHNHHNEIGVMGFIMIGRSTSPKWAQSRMAMTTKMTKMMMVMNRGSSSENNNTIDDDDDDDEEEEEDEDASTPPDLSSESVMRYDDDLTDRFKYKVHALMGTYDPVEGVQDDEYQAGNILNALTQFPQRYTFNVVGRMQVRSKQQQKQQPISSSSDSADAVTQATNYKEQEEYITAVKQVVFGTTGDDDIVCIVKPRGAKFLKVQCEANVQSVAMINMIYDDLDKLDATVMKF